MEKKTKGFQTSDLAYVAVYTVYNMVIANMYNVVSSFTSGMEAVFGLIMATVTGAGIPEAIAAAVLVGVITTAILRSGVMQRKYA